MRFPRPWGHLDWVMTRVAAGEWSLLGVIGAEGRSMSAWTRLRERGILVAARMMDIGNLASGRWADEVAALRGTRRAEFLAAGGRAEELEAHDLAERHGRIVDAARDAVANCRGNLVIDISVMPKRFFFPVVKTALKTAGVRNLIVTYTVPRSYSDEPLAEDPSPWNVLPMFMNRDPEPSGVRLLLVGVGHEPLGLPRLLESDEFRGMSVRMLLPFPSSPAGVRKNWDFIRRCEGITGRGLVEPVRTDAYNLGEVFDRLKALTDQGRLYSYLAPFGPKTMSLGMCIFGAIYDMPAFYTQPRFYHPEYSTGVDMVDGRPRIYAYPIILDGRHLFT